MSPSPHGLFNIAASGLLAGQLQVDVIANNIANMNTVGYKQSRLDFQEFLSRLTTGQEVRSGVWPAATPHLFEQGPLQASVNALDLAVDGDGLFAVRLPDGRIGYTRDGSFRRDASGAIVTASGFPLVHDGAIPADAFEVHVNPDGSIMARVETEEGQEWQQVGAIQLARFFNPAGLQADESNVYLPTPASGVAQVSPPGQDGVGEIVGSALEGSNTDLSQAMVDLMMAQRSYAFSMRALQQADEMLALATQIRR